VRRCVFLLVAALSASVGPTGAAEAERTTRVFDLRFLRRGQEAAGIVLPGPSLRSEWSYDSTVDPWKVDERDERRLAPGDIRNLLERFIDPDSWHNSRNSIEDPPWRLVITQSPETLGRVAAFLALLGDRASRVIVAELALVPPESIERAAPGCLKPGASPWLDGSAFDAALLADSGRAAWLTAMAAEGEFVRLQPRSVSMIFGGLEVNQTGVLPVVDPDIQASFEGAAAELRVMPLPQEGWLRAELKLGRRGVRGKERRKILQAEIELPSAAQEEVGTSVIVPEGKTILIGSFSPGQAGEQPSAAESAPSFAALLRVRRMTAGSPRRPGGRPHVFEAAALLMPPPKFALRLGGSDEMYAVSVQSARPKGEVEVSRFGVGEEGLLNALAEEAGLEDAERFVLAGGVLFHAEPEPVSTKIRARLGALAREHLRLVTVELWQGPASPGEITGDGAAGALLGLGWIDRMASRPGIRARISSLVRAQASLASVLSRSFVADVEMVSGGTGEITAIVAQPVVATTGAGLLLNIACDLVPGSGFAQLHVHGEMARPPVFGRQARARASLEVAPPKEGEASPIQATAEWVMLDLPDEDGDRWEHLVAVPLGRPVLLNALPDPASPGKTRALVAVVHEFELRD